ncbi:MAG: hypothetical protein WBG17_01980 [Burkholderiaceae bacterium]
MRSTKASAALERLKRRSGEPRYSMVRTADERFYLVLKEGPAPARLCEPLPLDEFVAFVNGYGPQDAPRRVTKNDLAFERQLRKK